MATQAAPDREVLPGNVVPRHYRLSLTPDFKTFKYKGKVDVKLDVTEATSSIVLNALDMEFHSASLNSGGKSIKSKNIDVDEEKQIATLEFVDKVEEDEQATLTIEFTGILNDKMAGFYRSSYVDSTSGEQKWLATTQMGSASRFFAHIEPTDARRAFPCWVCPFTFPS
jgi:aminopeptidase 2